MTFEVQKKRARRKPTYAKKSGVFATPGSFIPSGAGDTRSSVLKAAEMFAATARKNAARFSKRIPVATHVESYQEQQAMVVTDGMEAPNAAPFEFGERHPLNYPNQTRVLGKTGKQRHWVKQPLRRYMSRAAADKTTVESAAEAYAEAEKDLLAEEYGYND